MPIIPPSVVPVAISDVASLAGVWRSSCLPIGKGGRHGAIATITLAGKRLGVLSQVYARPDCAAPTFQIRYRARLVAMHVLGDRILFEHKALSTTLTPQDASVVTQYNLQDGLRHGCGLNGWKLDVAKSVAGQTCDPLTLAKNGVTLFDAAWRQTDGTLRFGALPTGWANDNEVRRPATPLPIVYARVTQ